MWITRWIFPSVVENEEQEVMCHMDAEKKHHAREQNQKKGEST